jgi:hypothetical protein
VPHLGKDILGGSWWSLLCATSGRVALRLCGVAQLLRAVAVAVQLQLQLQLVAVAVAVAVTSYQLCQFCGVLSCSSDVPILRQFCGDSVVYPR